MASTKPPFVTVKTTLPILPFSLNSARAPVATFRLLIRPLSSSDVYGLHRIRSQLEVMANDLQGRPDATLEETQPQLTRFLPPNDEKTYHFAICLKETEEFIGIGGCHSIASVFGWPAIGYMLTRERWGQGLTTEFTRAFLEMWKTLPRREVEIQVDPRSLLDGEVAGGVVKEQVASLTPWDNFASARVMEKSGFEEFLVWSEPDLRDPSVDIELRGFRYVWDQN